MGVEWKELVGHENYLVSSDGRIMRKDNGKIHVGSVNNKGYIRFELCENGKRFSITGHRAVAIAFLELDPQKPIVNHKDGNKKNNTVKNLEWCTYKENTRHAIDVLHKQPPVQKPVMCIETNKIYKSSCDAERKTGIIAASITRCCKGQRKSTHGLHWKYADIAQR